MSTLNDKIFEVITSDSCWDRLEFNSILAANAIEILVLEDRIKLFQDVYNGARGGIDFVFEIKNMEERLNELKNKS